MKRYSAHALVTESPLVDEFAFVENESGRYYRMDDVQKAMAAKDAKIELLSDALDGIAKVASMARTITKRVDWIIARAKTALQGDAWDKSYKPMPNNNVQRVERLRFQIDELNEQLRVSRIKIFLDEIDAAKAGNEFLVKESENINGCVIVYPDADTNAKQPRIKTVGLFDSNDVLRAAFILTRDCFNRTQLSTIRALGDAQ